MRKGIFCLLLCAAALLGFGSSSAHAAFVLVIDDPSTVGLDVRVVDDSPAGTATQNVGLSNFADAAPIPGTVLFAGSINANWFVTVTTGLSKPTIGSATEPIMDLSYVAVSSGSGALLIGLTDTDFGPVPPSFELVSAWGGTTNGAPGSSSSAQVEADWVDQPGGPVSGNKEFSAAFGPDAVEPDAVIVQGPFGSGAFASTATAPGPIGSPFSLTIYIGLSHSAGGASSGDLEASVVPAPASLLLLLTGVPALGGVWLRRRKVK